METERHGDRTRRREIRWTPGEYAQVEKLARHWHTHDARMALARQVRERVRA